MQASDWDLAASTNPRAVAIDVLVTFAECGQVDDAHTLLESSITYGTKSVTITTWVGRPQGGEGAAGCVASLPRLFTIPLREPVGSRILLNGGVVPAQPVVLGTMVVDPGDASLGPDPRLTTPEP